MSDFRIRKVKVLQGRAKAEAEKQGLNSEDLVIVKTSVKSGSLPEYHIEKIEGDPVSYLLKCANQKEAKKSNKDVAFLLMLPFILTVLILCLVGNLFWILFWIELSGCVLLFLWLYALSYDLEEGEGSET